MAKRMAPMERLLSKVDRTGDCWIWIPPVEVDGYGRFWLNGHLTEAHRAAYRLLAGPIPAGRELDHLCHTRDLTCPGGSTCGHRRCVRPDHLEPVDRLANSRRSRSFTSENAAKTHCPEGHPYDAANTYINPGRGYRICRICKAASKAASRNVTRPHSGSLPRECLRALGAIGEGATTTQVLQWLRSNGEQVDPYRVTTSLGRLADRKPPLVVKAYQGTRGGQLDASVWELADAGHALLAREATAIG